MLKQTIDVALSRDIVCPQRMCVKGLREELVLACAIFFSRTSAPAPLFMNDGIRLRPVRLWTICWRLVACGCGCRGQRTRTVRRRCRLERTGTSSGLRMRQCPDEFLTKKNEWFDVFATVASLVYVARCCSVQVLYRCGGDTGGFSDGPDVHKSLGNSFTSATTVHTKPRF